MTAKEFAEELVESLTETIDDLQLRSKGTDYNEGYIEALYDVREGIKEYLRSQ